jgi:hypothetical protein
MSSSLKTGSHSYWEKGGNREHILATLILWSIWNRGNDVIFREKRVSAQFAFKEIEDTAEQWSLAVCKALKPLMVAHSNRE